MFHVKHEGWTPEDLSPAQVATFGLYEALLLSHAVPRGIVSLSDGADLRTRHILDSLRAVPHIPSGARIVDLGSGAGFPGLPVAVARPELEVILSEPRQARAAFLELAVEKLGLANVGVFASPAEELTGGFEVCLARGFGDAARTWGVARGLLGPGGALIYWAGRSFSADDVPTDAQVAATGEATLESGGPIVIMTRQ
ncbi:MAG: class I SAM-dependent methyltransferase [Actinobacteria bacterium]|nr:class I SAM-dependent methyltransferase [Actinomycetota bacterium]